MGFEPAELARDAPSIVLRDGDSDKAAGPWRPLFRHDCSFPSKIFMGVMINLIRNPNINSSWLFRADILFDEEMNERSSTSVSLPDETPTLPCFSGFELRRCMVRKLIPRNTLRDNPMDQSCLIYEQSQAASEDAHDSDGIERTLVVYLPHVSEMEMPFYHPKVQGIAFLHEWTAAEGRGSVSVSYLFFNDNDRSVDRLTRTAFQLLKVLYKHGQGRLAGYQKRVQHDVLIPQARVQNTYAVLKLKYARGLIDSWAEVTDPDKHIFEDLSIAAFLIELWLDMYGTNPFPGFVDIGCGNGLLVWILNQEGYRGWGFDARARKSWANYNTVQPCAGSDIPSDSLQQLVLLPPPVSRARLSELASDDFSADLIHDGVFPKGTFIISNHADELTPWTPILAAISESPFIMIPCCSHNLTGARYRAPTPKDKTKAESSYASLVDWVAQIARDCGWEVEQEILRIPSTRNTALVGRKRLSSEGASSLDIDKIVERYGGTAEYLENVVKLAKKPRSQGQTQQGTELKANGSA
ncbi:hypothetical protein B0T16DRAFT_33743 [Cercophora newfieldiana]|uniref:tRNA (uracil-O(2)-)-methyltransferase n=1 Tax=Cercophora newfieldiana TaxID=92897 RepID=A0AA40CZJ7_9PEZI|nr:hypothetical protein B0T16DRAFT_33743 [Cercophora newfieldiana]